jgi:uroporphyrinogen decarboxylase
MPEEMTPRELVRLALNHHEPDRIPIDLGGSICSSIHKNAYVELKEYLGMEVEEIKMADYVQQLPYLDEALLERFGVDFRMVQLPAATAPDIDILDEGNYYAFIDRWGSKLHMPKQDGLYFDWVDFPIKEPTAEALDSYLWPEPDPPAYNARTQATR